MTVNFKSFTNCTNTIYLCSTGGEERRAEKESEPKPLGQTNARPHQTMKTSLARCVPRAWVGTRTATYVRLCCLSSPTIQGLTRERQWGAGGHWAWVSEDFPHRLQAGRRSGLEECESLKESPFFHESGGRRPYQWPA